MGAPTVEQRLKSMLAEQMGRLEDFFVGDVLLVSDLEMDELDAVDLALGLEEQWPGILWTEDFDLELLTSIRTFQGLVAYVTRRVGAPTH